MTISTIQKLGVMVSSAYNELRRQKRLDSLHIRGFTFAALPLSIHTSNTHPHPFRTDTLQAGSQWTFPTHQGRLLFSHVDP
jgi:hypothetical protein